MFSSLGYCTPEPEHVTNSPITGKPYDETKVIEELQAFDRSAHQHTHLRRTVLDIQYKTYIVIDSGADQTALDSGNVILDQEEFPGTSMGGPSSTMENVYMYKFKYICIVESTEVPIIIRHNNAITYDEPTRNKTLSP